MTISDLYAFFEYTELFRRRSVSHDPQGCDRPFSFLFLLQCAMRGNICQRCKCNPESQQQSDKTYNPGDEPDKFYIHCFAREKYTSRFCFSTCKSHHPLQQILLAAVPCKKKFAQPLPGKEASRCHCSKGHTSNIASGSRRFGRLPSLLLSL